MNSGKTCQMCGSTFYPDQDWKKICILCYKKSKRFESESAYYEQILELREENQRLRYQLAIAKPAASAIPPDILKALIRLAHPDKHGNSQAANHVTACLLDQREHHD